MKSGEKDKLKPHRLPEKGAMASIHIDLGDRTILKVYKKLLQAPMRTVIHFMIGTAARCYEEKHIQQIQDLEERVQIQAEIIVTYIKKYGQLPRKQR